MIIRPVNIGDNRFNALPSRKIQPRAAALRQGKQGRSLWTSCARNRPDSYPQDMPAYPARVLNRALKSSWMRGSLSRSSRIRLQACITVV
jgi:hypothetical protein